MKVTSQVDHAYRLALQVRAHAHCPYSKFAVGSALQLRGRDKPIVGCNIENASFGATLCAERVAFYNARSNGQIDPEFIVIVTGESQATVPCALCLQIMAEFCADDFTIYLGNEVQILKSYKLKELLPYPFRTFEVEK